MVTTGIMTFLPLLTEIKRESMHEEIEALQISKAISEGRAPTELANAGLTSAIDPNIFKG